MHQSQGKALTTNPNRPTIPNNSELHRIIALTNEEHYKVIASTDPLSLQTMVVRAWLAQGVKTADIFLTFHGTTYMTEVSIGPTSITENPLIDASQSQTVKIGKLNIFQQGHATKYEINLNDGAKALLENGQGDKTYPDFAQFEILTKLNALRSTVEHTIKDLQDQSHLFGGARFYGIPDYILERALQEENLQNDPRFETFKSTGVLNIDALGQINHRKRYEIACNEFALIQALQRNPSESNFLWDKGFLLVPDAKRRNELKNYRVTKTPYEHQDDKQNIYSGRSDARHHVTVLDDQGTPVARAVTYRASANMDDPRLEQAYRTAVQEGADVKGGIILYEITAIRPDAPKEMKDSLKDLVNIVFAQTNCETLIELSAADAEQMFSSTTYSLEVHQSIIAGERMLRMAAGQIFLARARADEIIADPEMTQQQKDDACEEVGRNLVTWFQLSLGALQPDEAVVKDPDLLGEWKQWAENSPLYSVLDNARSYAFNSQFHGQSWFNGTSESYAGNWDSFEKNGAKRILEAIQSTGKTASAYVAEYQLSTLTPSIRASLAKLLQSWRIDDSKKKRQLGLEWKVTEEELQLYLEKDSQIFYLFIDGEKEIDGVRIDFTNIAQSIVPEQQLPSIGGAEQSRKFCDDHGIPYKHARYVMMISSNKERGPMMKEEGIDVYGALLSAGDQTGRWLGMTHDFGGVRIDDENFFGNPAMGLHIARKWVDESDEYNFKSKVGSTLGLVSRQIPDSKEYERESFPYSAFVWPNASKLNIVLGDPAVLAQADRINEEALRDATSAAGFANEYFEERGLYYCRARADHGTLSGGQHGVSILKNNSQFYFFQVAPNKDLWMNRDTDSVASFKECLEWFAIEAKRPPY